MGPEIFEEIMRMCVRLGLLDALEEEVKNFCGPGLTAYPRLLFFDNHEY